MDKKKQLLNVSVLAITEQELLDTLDYGVVVTPNLDHVIKLQKDREFYDIYKQADWVVCDSRILYYAYKFTKNKLPEVIPGSSFFTSYYMHHRDDEDCKIFLLGAKEGVAAKAMQMINQRCDRNIVVGAHSPSFGFEKRPDEIEDIIDIVNRSGATTVLVGVGAPKQEKWIMRYKDRMPGVKVWLALGATIDFEAGNVKRAPKVFQALALEWLYRFCKEPKRLFRRYFIDDMKFFYYYAQQLLGFYKDPFAKP